MEQRVLVVQNAGELPVSVRDALSQSIFRVKYVEGFANARKSVIEARPDLILFDVESWAMNVEEVLCEFSNLRNTHSSRKVILSCNGAAEDRAAAL